MEIYIIIVLSFAIMYHLVITREVIQVVKQVAIIHDVNSNRSLMIYSIINFVFTLIAAPFYLWLLLTENNTNIVRNIATKVLLEFYDLEKTNVDI